MAYILNIESSTKNCSISISKDDEMLCLCEEYDENYSHSEKLHTFIEWALEGAEINIKQLDAVCVSKGPGSYTGLRIGVSAAKGLCYALDIPLLSVETLDVLAESVSENDYDLIVPMLDARRMEVYTKTLNQNKETLTPTEAKVLDKDSFQEFADKKVVFVGNGAKKAKEVLNIKNALFLDETQTSAKDMIHLAYNKFQQKAFEDVAYFEPYYLKDFIAGKPKKLL